jgi:hypothetical protein
VYMKRNVLIAAVLSTALVGFIVFTRVSPHATGSVDQKNTTGTIAGSNRPMMGQDSFGLDVCNEVPKALVEGIMGRPVKETEDRSGSSDTSCLYYTNKEKLEYVLVQVSYLSTENQKIGQETLGRTITTNNAIPMENFIAMQDDGQINAIYLIMAPNKFVRVDRTSNTANDDQLVSLAKKVALIITGK